jgi:hypothetical protein
MGLGAGVMEAKSSQDRTARQNAVARYLIAALCLCAAYWSAVGSDDKARWVGVAFFIVFAALLAREASKLVVGAAKWILGLLLAGAIIWAVVAGASALPVSLAIIIVAIIVAVAVRR